MNLSHRIFETTAALPENWDDVANGNLFLTERYFKVLEESAPANMRCFFIGIFSGEQLVGRALSQFLDMASVESFGNRDTCLKESIRLFFFKRFSAKVLILGNNMLSGENAFIFRDDIKTEDGILAVDAALNDIRNRLSKENRTPHLVIWKDFPEDLADRFPSKVSQHYFRFTAQPSMIFDIQESWKSEKDYVADLSKKYRDQYKRARKKVEGVEMRQLTTADIEKHNDTIYELYRTVSDNAPFNTFYLNKNHWRSLRKNLKDDFLLYGYFEGEKLIGFDTLIQNGKVMETYFLGYDATQQKQRMLYLNMLYNMIGYAVKKQFKEVIFARTALEIKSSVGAYPLTLFGFMKHSNPIIDRWLPRLFRYFEPEAVWQQRHPFKSQEASAQQSSSDGEVSRRAVSSPH